jgi:hypothetical protein
MKLMKSISNKPDILYDGLQDGIAKDYQLKIDDREILFNIPEILDGNFQDLFKNMSESDAKKIIAENGLINDLPEYYIRIMSKEEYSKLSQTANYHKSEYHLQLNYLIRNDYLMLFTYGEKQPSRWILILEGVWQIGNDE